MIRTVRPTDLIALWEFTRQPYPNQVVALDQLAKEGERLSFVSACFEQWLPWDESRHTWIAKSGRQIQGLISVHIRSSPMVWELEYLFLQPEAIDICPDLLERLIMDGGAVGVEKVFVRLPAGSPLVGPLRQMGFSAYTTEYLYALTPLVISSKTAQPATPFKIRPRQSVDIQALYELYRAEVPESVRWAEAMTLREWCDSRNRCSLWRLREYVAEAKEGLIGWLQVGVQGDLGQMEVLAGVRPEGLEAALIHYGLGRLGSRSRILTLVRSFQGPIQGALHDAGFEKVGEYLILVKQLAVRGRQPSLIPMQA